MARFTQNNLRIQFQALTIPNPGNYQRSYGAVSVFYGAHLASNNRDLFDLADDPRRKSARAAG